MYQSTYFIDKSSNTFADNLAAFGLAFVLAGIANQRAQIRLEDAGSVFVVVCEPSLKLEWVEQCKFFSGAPFLITYDRKAEKKVVKGTPLLPNDLPESGGNTVADYEAAKQDNTIFFDWLKSLPPEEKKQAVRGEIRAPATPHPDWDLFRAINPAALQGYNALVAEWWRGQEAFPELLKIVLQMTAQTPNDLDGAEKAWAKLSKANGWEKPKDATAIQLFNPSQGKGVNSSKAEWRDPNNVKGFWLLEWLKVVGLRYGGATRLVRGTKDRKTYALAPARLDWGKHTAIMGKFQRAMAGGASAVQLDIYAVLRYTQTLLAHYEDARAEDLEVELFGHRASDLVSGLHMAFYKSLGNAIATMNIASLNLPGWVRPQSREDLTQLQTALDEHLAIVRSLDESRGDQFALLCSYRDFLSANDLTRFFEFTTAYSSFITHQYERRKYVRPFTTTTLEVLFMNSDDPKQTFGQIVQSDGFKNIAYAIRYSTVVPQGRKAKGGKPTVDVRYGLGQELARKAAYPAEFLAKTAEFIHLYNAENAQLRENKRNPYRKNVTTADIDALAELVDRFGSKVICNMLVAYGYAREPYESKDEDQSAGDADAEVSDLTTEGESDDA
ncbi:MAG: hypothetical protein HY872_13110 [Chloroflexi bacterium]|nr:hypothetical protein [Chloroflexota bacterium]